MINSGVLLCLPLGVITEFDLLASVSSSFDITRSGFYRFLEVQLGTHLTTNIMYQMSGNRWNSSTCLSYCEIRDAV